MENRNLVLIFLLCVSARLTEGQVCSADAEKKMKRYTAPQTPWAPPPLNCSRSVQAAITVPDGKTLFFQEDWYWGVQLTGSMLDDYPRPIAADWPGLPSNLDAALSLWDNRVFFFKGSKYWRYEDYTLQPGYPKEISDGFCGVENDITSAVYWPETLTFYFFKGDKVFRFNSSESQKSPAEKKDVSAEWKNLPVNMDAAVTWFNRFLYFFKGDLYWRYETNGINENSYPRNLVSAWHESCEDLNKRIDKMKAKMG